MSALEQEDLVFISHSHSLTRPLSKRSERSLSAFFLAFALLSYMLQRRTVKKRKKEIRRSIVHIN